MSVFLTFVKQSLWASITCASLFAGAAAADTNLVTKASHYSVAETMDRLEKAVAAKGMRVFARIDHGGEAKKAGLEMKPRPCF
jgi:uncharacterized protein (DUF302 family)